MSFKGSLKRVAKILILGDTGIGKTSLVMRVVKGIFPDPEKLKSTIGSAFFVKTYSFDVVELSAQIWDFAGQERFRSFMRNMFKGADGGIFVFDLTNKVTLDDLESFWIPEIEEKLKISFREGILNDKCFLLVGNKKDVIDQRNVSNEEIQNFVEKYGLPYFETSAKTGENAELVFDELMRAIYEVYVQRLEEKIRERQQPP